MWLIDYFWGTTNLRINNTNRRKRLKERERERRQKEKTLDSSAVISVDPRRSQA